MRFHWLILICTLAAVAAAGWAVSPASFAPHGGQPQQSLAAAQPAAGIAPVSVAAPQPLAAAPRAEIREVQYDFGTVEPLRTHRHSFEIRNTGAAPLTLHCLGSSCKCLEVGVLDPAVAPGAAGRVVVAWDAKLTQDVFLQRATIETNDPGRPMIDLTVEGKTLLMLAADPPELIAPRVKPDQSAHLTTTIVSQVWDKFTIDCVESSLAGATWTLSPAVASDLQRLQAKSGWRLDVTLPADMPEGTFSERLRFTARPGGADSTAVDREIRLEGKVLRRLAVYGKDIRPWGAIEAGVIPWPQGYRSQFVVKVHDDEPELGLTSIDAQPSFIAARLEPYQETGKPGVYRLLVRIPPTGKAGAYQGDNQGKLTLSFNHPRIQSLVLGIDFVLPPAPANLRRSLSMAVTHEP